MTVNSSTGSSKKRSAEPKAVKKTKSVKNAGKTAKIFKEDTLPSVFQARVKKYGDRDCVRYRKDGEYVPWSWNDMDRMVRRTGYFLMGRGIGKKDHVAIFSANRYEWWVSDMGALSAGAATVPVYATDSPEEAQYILKDSGAKICFVSTEDHLNRVLKVKKNLPELKLIVTFDEVKTRKRGVISFREALEEGAACADQEKLDRRIHSIKPKDLATVIYTSGTTGAPKGVMLSHDNFIQDGILSLERFHPHVTDSDRFFSILPLSHALERNTGYYIPIYVGATVYFCEDVSKTLMRDLTEVRPTIMVSVPRIFEKIHAAVLSKLSDAPASKKMIFGWAMKIAKKNVEYTVKRKPRKGLFAKEYDLADKLIFSKLRKAVGFDNINFVVSGGGPLSVSDAEFFMGMGLTFCEGYGMTETSPVTNANKPGFLKPGTVGPALKNTDVKISDEGEILIRGPQVMMGYYKNKKATKEVMTEDGFIRTGDKGMIDEDGNLVITGRIKDIIITSGGKNISPQNIEGKLQESLYIEQSAVIGERRKFLSALVVPEFAELEKWAKKNGIKAGSRAELVKNPQVTALYQKEFDKYMAGFARVEQIKKFTLLSQGWSQETGELTPSLKIKRHVIDEKFAAEIEAMYKD